mmetsp:Transcript_1322/g.4140  ORF Transcript_1322/g.4140 Transcript_1322/m.4140 type:complete len:404 (-) Transcript_1322:1317-2528(-)
MTIVVLGASFCDVSIFVDQIPTVSETRIGRTFTKGFGGKGANQAVQAALLVRDAETTLTDSSDRERESSSLSQSSSVSSMSLSSSRPADVDQGPPSDQPDNETPPAKRRIVVTDERVLRSRLLARRPKIGLFTCVGDDEAGREMISRAKALGIATDLIAVDSRTNGDAMPTGTAFISVDPSGQNSIIVVPGAANLLSTNGAALVRRLVAPESDGYPVWRNAKVVLASTEVGAVAVAAAFAAAPEGATRMWNPAPVPESGVRSILAHTDILIPNEREAAQLVDDADRVIDTVEAGEKVANEVATKYADVFRGILIVTMGKLGAIIRRPDGALTHIAVPEAARVTKVVDSTGAGDSFCGAFAVASLRHPLDLAVTAACTVASVSVTATGTQSSYAPRERFANYFP